LTPITFPFPVCLYGNTYTSGQADSNGVLGLTSASSTFGNTCLPGSAYSDAIFGHWDDLLTTAQAGCASYPGGTCGIYTALTGTAPNRTFAIEWRAVYFDTPSSLANFEILLHENSCHFEIIHGTLGEGGTSATSGVQQGSGTQFTQFACNSSMANNTKVTYTLGSCGTPSATPTFTATATSTATATHTPTKHSDKYTDGIGNRDAYAD
jgi:hypothetical protein